MAEESSSEDYPTEIEEFLTGFQSSVTSVQSVIDSLMSVSKGEHLKVIMEIRSAHSWSWRSTTTESHRSSHGPESLNDLNQLDPLEQAKLDLMSAYTLNSLFWMYLTTQGVNPKEHGIKQELERIRMYMNRVKEITDKKKAARLDKDAASRFVRNALWDAEDSKAKGDSERPQKAKQRKLN